MDFQTTFIHLIFSNWGTGRTVGCNSITPQACYTMLSFHQLQPFSGVFDNSGWPKRMGEYKNEVGKAKETGGKKAVFEILIPNPVLSKGWHTKRAAMMESFSGSLGWDALALTLLSSLTQQHSSWQQGIIYATAFQLQASVAASSKCRASISGFIIIPSSDGICSSTIQEIQREPACLHVLVDENVQVQMKSDRFHIVLASSWH